VLLRSIRLLISQCIYFDAGSAGVGDLDCFNLLEIVEATLRSMVREGYFYPEKDLCWCGLSWWRAVVNRHGRWCCSAPEWVVGPWSDPFLCRITALIGSVVAGAGVNPADQRWGFWPLLPLSSLLQE